MLEIPDIELIRRCLVAHKEEVAHPHSPSGFTDALLAVEQRLVDLRAELEAKSVSQLATDVWNGLLLADIADQHPDFD